MVLVDDAAQIGTVLRVGTVPFLQYLTGLLEELLLYLLATEYVIGRDTRLAGIDKLAPQDAPRGDGDVGRTVQIAGALSTEL